MIATGSRPYRPPDVDFNHPRIFDSDTILDLEYTPQSITIYGAGVVGCEYTSMFRNLDCKVNLVNTRDKLLEFLDDEIIDALAYHLRDRGVIIRHGETYERIEGATTASCSISRAASSSRPTSCSGRTAAPAIPTTWASKQLGIQPDHRGQIKVNENFQTAVPHIYAVGDVIGFPSLASAAYMQGRSPSTHILTGKGDHVMVRDIPTGIYTSPEISSLGRTERELTADNSPMKSAMRCSRASPGRRSPAAPPAC